MGTPPTELPALAIPVDYAVDYTVDPALDVEFQDQFTQKQ